MMITRKTYVQKPTEVTRRWVEIDAASAPLGRVATTVARYLTGKYKPTYTPHLDAGDYVVVVNAADAVVTGNKESDKKYYRHSGYPGGMKEATLAEVREKDPVRIIEMAVKGMLPKNKLADERLARLKVYTGSDHKHDAQKPEKVEVS